MTPVKTSEDIVPLTNPNDDEEDAEEVDEPFDFQQGSEATSRFAMLPSNQRDMIQNRLRQTPNPKQVLQKKLGHYRRLSQTTDVVGTERKIKALENISEESEDWERAIDEIWLDLQVLRMKRGETDEAIVWLQNEFSELR